MSISFKLKNQAPSQSSLLVLPLATKTVKNLPHYLPKEISKVIQPLFKTTPFSKEYGSHLFYTPFASHLNHLVINLCSVSSIDWRRLGGNIGQQLHTSFPKSVALDLSLLALSDNDLQLLVEGIVLGAYRFLNYKTTPTPLPATTITISMPKVTAQLRTALINGERFGNATNQARDWANMPSNDLNPHTFITMAKSALKSLPVTVSVITHDDAKKLGMNALLGVGKGSAIPPRLLVMKYNINRGDKPIALVGKGVTFDTGGISIKGSKGMSDMKADMSGAAAVLSAMVAMGQFKPSLPVLGLIPLAENMPDGGAQRPGDIVKAMNGKTIEILNTDAEGRLILADALCYAVKQGARKIVDIATLTGACGVALGELAMGLLSNNEQEVAAMKMAAEKTGERVWQLPLYDDYLDYLDSNIADIAHCSEGRYGGTCTAAKFLEQFVDTTPWIHLDIASVMIQKKNNGTQVKGMSGAGARNLIQYILDQD